MVVQGSTPVYIPEEGRNRGDRDFGGVDGRTRLRETQSPSLGKTPSMIQGYEQVNPQVMTTNSVTIQSYNGTE